VGMMRLGLCRSLSSLSLLKWERMILRRDCFFYSIESMNE